MTSIDDVFGGKALKAEQLKGKKPAILTIASVEIVEFKNDDGVKKKKPVISFNGTDKTLVCNLTNANTIAELSDSRDTDNWTGTKIKLVVERVQFGPKLVDSIRVKDPSFVDKIESGPVAKEAMDDEIPF